jgi:hypothetical protein
MLHISPGEKTPLVSKVETTVDIEKVFEIRAASNMAHVQSRQFAFDGDFNRERCLRRKLDRINLGKNSIKTSSWKTFKLGNVISGRGTFPEDILADPSAESGGGRAPPLASATKIAHTQKTELSSHIIN